MTISTLIKNLFATFILFFAILCVNAQVTILTFVGEDRTGQDYVQLDRVSVFNLTQSWHEVLYYPDTTLILGTVGIENYVENDFHLMQNVPNPFDGVTDFALSLPSGQDVALEIFDANGKKVAAQDYPSLSAGTHLFRATLSTPQIYLLSANIHEGKTSIKMINTGDGGGNSIIYLGMANADGSITLQLKEGRGASPYPFSLGDRMQYTGYAIIDGTERVSNVVEKNQYSDADIALQFDIARPAVTTQAATDVLSTSATLNGDVVSDNNVIVTERGFCYVQGTSVPTLSDSTIVCGSGLGAFSTVATNLSAGSTYRFCAYAKNAIGVTYGNPLYCNTNATLPDVTTSEPSNVTATSFVSGGNVLQVNCIGTATRGICWNTTGTPTIADTHTTDGAGAGTFVSSVTGLECGTTYYVRAYATNSIGTAYGEEYVVTTLVASLPEVTTLSATIYDCIEIVTSAEVLNDNCESITARGFCYATTPNPTINDAHTNNGNGLGTILDTLTVGGIHTTYYVRAYATNSVGTAYGEELSVTTGDFPTVTTANVSAISDISAAAGGNITDDGGTTITARGVCWSTSQNPTVSNSHTIDGSGTGTFTSSLTGLTANTTYYVRAYATNCVGTAYGEQKSFTTAPFVCGISILTDADGNTYNTLQIGYQCWMKENLRTTKYADGTAIPQGSFNATATAYWYYPNNSSSNMSTYGLLYNWPAVMRNASSSSGNPSGVQGICPTGWHVPSDAEWTQLTDYVSSQSEYCCNGNTANIAKALASQTGWPMSGYHNGTCYVIDTSSSNNATGFSALPAGSQFGGFGQQTYFWSTSRGTYSTDALHYMLMYNNSRFICAASRMDRGESVRCVQDRAESVLPTIVTSSITDIAQTSATCGGDVTDDGGATITARGVCWSTSQNPTVSNSHTTNGIGSGSFTSSIIGLGANTTYYVRAYATNCVGTAYGEQKSFTTTIQVCGTVTDVDGNTYNTVQIGQQCWMRENLRTTRFADSTIIPLNLDIEAGVSYASRYYPNNSSSNVATYGYLYNWNAVMHNSGSSISNPSGVQGICPTGWHVPSDAEWTLLTDYVSSQSEYCCDGDTVNIAKALASQTGWNSSTNACAVGTTPSSNNATGFSALPAGDYEGTCYSFGSYATFWTATGALGNASAYMRQMSYNNCGVYVYIHSRGHGISVRCVKD